MNFDALQAFDPEEKKKIKLSIVILGFVYALSKIPACIDIKVALCCLTQQETPYVR